MIRRNKKNVKSKSLFRKGDKLKKVSDKERNVNTAPENNIDNRNELESVKSKNEKRVVVYDLSKDYIPAIEITTLSYNEEIPKSMLRMAAPEGRDGLFTCIFVLCLILCVSFL